MPESIERVHLTPMESGIIQVESPKGSSMSLFAVYYAFSLQKYFGRKVVSATLSIRGKDARRH